MSTEAESIDLAQEELDLEASPARSSTGSTSTDQPDVVDEVVSGSPLHRWIDAELLSLFHRTIMTSRSVSDEEAGGEDSDEEDFFGRSPTMQTAESVVDVIDLSGEVSQVVEGASPTYDVAAQNLSYQIAIRKRGKVVGQKVLLNNITAEARHGEIMAIMGPSGASKSTLLDALAGRISRKSMSGSVLVNGVPMTNKFKRISSYTMQDDVHFPYLTPRETLMYSARLRLSNTISMEEKRKRVEAILDLLGLKACGDTRIGNDEIGGVSGGERRRISIGLDLIHDPVVLFLDEPTSGLDSTSALQVMQCLQKLAKDRSRTVVLSLHQPSYRILDTIDNTLVLATGNVVYHGHHKDMPKFFTGLGFVIPEHVTVVEYLMDKIEENKDDLEKLRPQQQETRALSPATKRLRQRTLSSYDYKVDSFDEPPATAVPEMIQIMPEDQPRDVGPAPEPVKFANSLWKETWILSGRTFINSIRTTTLFVSRITIVLITSLIMATLFFNANLNEEGFRERQVFFAFTIVILTFTSTEAMPVFLMERRIFMRETSRGAYRSSSYVLSYSIVILPFMATLAVLCTVSSYWAVGLVNEVFPVVYFSLVIFLVLSIANAFVAFLSGLAPNFITGLIIFGATSAYQFLFCGFFVPRHHIPKYWLWLHYGSFFKYSYEALLVNELRNLPGHVWFHGQTSERILLNVDCKRSISNQWLNLLYLTGFFVGFRILFYLTLRFHTNNIRK